jgi:hypothetical protein
MGKQRRKFETGIKQQIVGEVESGLLSVSAASRDSNGGICVDTRLKSSWGNTDVSENPTHIQVGPIRARRSRVLINML